MKNFLAGLFLLLSVGAASAQCTGIFPPGTVCGNNGLSGNIPKPISNSSALPALPQYQMWVGNASNAAAASANPTITGTFTAAKFGFDANDYLKFGAQIWGPTNGIVLYENGNFITPHVPVGPILDSGFNFPYFYWNGYWQAGELARMDMDWYHTADLDNLRSVNQQLQPGSDGTGTLGAMAWGGTWLAGDIAKEQIVYGPAGDLTITPACTIAGGSGTWTCTGVIYNSGGFSCTIASCNNTGVLTGGLNTPQAAITNYFMKVFNTAPPSDPLYANSQTASAGMTVASVGSLTGFTYLTYWNVGCCAFNDHNTTAAGTFHGSSAINNLDGPVGFYITRDVPADCTVSATFDNASHMIVAASPAPVGRCRNGSYISTANVAQGTYSITVSPSGGGAGTYTLSGNVGTIAVAQSVSTYRIPQNNDNVGVVQFLGPTKAVPQGGIPYAEMVVTIANPITPLGQLCFNTWGPASSGNGFARLCAQAGVAIGDSNGNWTDNGVGTLTVPSTGNIYKGANPLAITDLAGVVSGSWTPVVSTTGTVGTPAYNIQVGTYEQIGKSVRASFTIQLSGWTGSPTGSVLVTGLPKTSVNTANDNGTCNIPVYVVASVGPPTGLIVPNASTIQIYTTSTTSNAGMSTAQAGTTLQLIGTCIYHTAYP